MKESKTHSNTQDAFEKHEALNAIISGKKNRANINAETIHHYENLISECKKEIDNDIDVRVNEATIIELEESINLLKLSNNKISHSLMELKKKYKE